MASSKSRSLVVSNCEPSFREWSRQQVSRSSMTTGSGFPTATAQRLTVTRIWRDCGENMARKYIHELVAGLHLPGMQRPLPPCSRGSDCARGYDWARCEVMA